MTSPSNRRKKNGKGVAPEGAASPEAVATPDTVDIAEPSAHTSPADALAALDDSLDALTPPEPIGPENGAIETGEQPKKRRGRSPGSGRRKVAESAPVEPPSPAMIDAYGMAAAGVCRISFRVAGRVMGGAPSVWEVSEQEHAELSRAFGPLLAIHHDKVSGVLPYAEPVLLLYEMFSRRQQIAAAQVAELRRINGEGGGPENG